MECEILFSFYKNTLYALYICICEYLYFSKHDVVLSRYIHGHLSKEYIVLNLLTIDKISTLIT